MVDVGRLLGEQGGWVECRPHRHHQLETVSDRGERGGGGPGIQRGRARSFDIVEIQFGDEREIETRPLARAREPADIGPLGFHALVLDIAQPAAEYRQPVSEAHQRVPPRSSRKSTRRAKGSNPTTRGASATKLDNSLMS